MDTMLVRERYKVVQVLDVRENYAFVEAVDILDREKNSCLLNIYEGPLLRAYLPCFDRLDACPDFQGVFLEGESLAAVFRYRAQLRDLEFCLQQQDGLEQERKQTLEQTSLLKQELTSMYYLKNTTLKRVMTE